MIPVCSTTFLQALVINLLIRSYWFWSDVQEILPYRRVCLMSNKMGVNGTSKKKKIPQSKVMVELSGMQW